MSVNLHDNALIEHYLLGKLSDAEIRAFKIRLDNDREFARKFRLMQMFPEMMSPEAKQEYDEKNVKQEEPVKPKVHHTPPSVPTKWIWLSVTLFTLMVIGAIIWVLPKSTPKPESTTPPTVLKDSSKPVLSTITLPEKKADSVGKPQVEKKVIEPQKEAIELVRPTPGSLLKRSDEVVFQWIQVVDTFTRLYVYNTATDKLVLWRGIRPGIRELRVPANTFYPGTFYWYVGRNDSRRTFQIDE